MRVVARISSVLSFALVTACGEGQRTDIAASGPHQREINTEITIAQALEARDDNEVDILFEASLRKIPAVAQRVREIKQELDRDHINNSLCIASGRGTIGKAAFVCNHYDYDILVLTREPRQPLIANLGYIEEFAENPLRSSLTQAIRLIGSDAINEADTNCARIVFVDSGSGEVRKDIPILLIIMPTELMAQASDTDRDLQQCLQ